MTDERKPTPAPVVTTRADNLPSFPPQGGTGRKVATPAKGGIHIEWSESLAAPLPPMSLLIPALGIGAGAPVVFGGFGYSRKSLLTMSMCLDVALGEPVWGVHDLPKGPQRAVIVDYEQGRRLSVERLQRLARGRGMSLANLSALGSRLGLASDPRLHLDDEGSEEAFLRLADGTSLVVIDSLRAAALEADENDSRIRTSLDVLGRVSSKTGCVFAFLHHLTKAGGRSADDGGTPTRFALRGSGALYDAASSVYIFASDSAEVPTRVTHVKDRNLGRLVPEFTLMVDDVERDGDPRGGLAVEHLGSSDSQAQKTKPSTPEERIVTAIGRDGFQGTREGLQKASHVRASTFVAVLDAMLASGAIVRTDGGGFSLASNLPSQPSLGAEGRKAATADGPR